MEALKNGERIDDLEIDGLRIIQNPSYYCFTSDSVLLANTVKATPSDKVCDLGCGSGIIATLISHKKQARETVGIDVCETAVDMANRSAAMNGMQDKLHFEVCSVADAPKRFGAESFDVTVANPPYFKTDTPLHQNGAVASGRSEIHAELSDFVDCASKLTRYGGAFYVIIKVTRLAELCSLLVSRALEPKEITLVYPKRSKEVDTVIIRAKKGGAVGLTTHSLVVHNEDGTLTDEAKKLYSKA